MYLKGRFSLGQRGAGLQRALDYFQEALALDSSNARAHEGMSTALLLLGFYGYRPAHEAMPAARRFALNAIDLDSTAADPDGTLMVISWVYDWDWARAERHFNASCYLCGGRLDEAETLCRRALELDPLMWNAERFLCTTLLVQGRLDEAIAHAQHALSVSNRNHWLLQISAQILMTAGKQKEATELAKELIDSGQHGYVPCGSLAAGYAILGRIDEAFEWVERAYREREPLPIWRHWPIPFNNDPRMQSIYRRMGL